MQKDHDFLLVLPEYVQVQFLETFHNHIACFLFIGTFYFLFCHICGTRNGVMEIIGMSRSDIGNIHSGLCPGGGIGGVGMYTPPISGNALYRTTWVGVSEDGRREPSTTLPSRFTTTMSSAFISSYDTPLGLITTKPVSRSMAETFPHVKITSPCFTKSRLARNTFLLIFLT